MAEAYIRRCGVELQLFNIYLLNLFYFQFVLTCHCISLTSVLAGRALCTSTHGTNYLFLITDRGSLRDVCCVNNLSRVII